MRVSTAQEDVHAHEILMIQGLIVTFSIGDTTITRREQRRRRDHDEYKDSEDINEVNTTDNSYDARRSGESTRGSGKRRQ